jgi:hypothetical protein
MNSLRMEATVTQEWEIRGSTKNRQLRSPSWLAMVRFALNGAFKT